MKFIVLSHGNFALELIEVSKMVFGTYKNVVCFGLQTGMATEDFLNLVQSELEKTKEPILFLCDIKGGTPFNVANLLSKGRPEIKLIYGINVPLFLELLSHIEENDLNQLLNEVKESICGTIGIIP